MPRPKNHQAHISAAVGQLLRAVASVVDSVDRAVSAGREVKGATQRVGKAAGDIGHAVHTKGAKLAKAIKASWANYTPAQRRARVAKMHAWRKRKKQGE